MDISVLLAKYLGPVMLLTGTSLLLNKHLARDVMADVLRSPALLMTAGFMALMVGLTVVIFHNLWVAGWPVIITIYGWLALLVGIVRTAFPGAIRKMANRFGKNNALMKGVFAANVLLGAFLTYKGFF